MCMSHDRDQWEQESTGLAETFLKYVGVASVALTGLLAFGIVAGLLFLFVPTNGAIGTVVFTGLLLAIVYAVSQYGESDPR